MLFWYPKVLRALGLLYCFSVVLSHDWDDEETHQVNVIPQENVDTDVFLKTYSQFNKYTVSIKETNLTTLVYVTPWNNHGYDIAKIFAAKFSLVSPVWFQLRVDGAAFKITGEHDIDKAWVDSVRKSNPEVKVVPRLLFEGWGGKDYSETVRSTERSSSCINLIVNFLEKHKFDGIVLEIWSQHSGTSQEELIQFLQKLGKSLREAERLFIMVIPPPVHHEGYEGRFNRHHFKELTSHVDYFSLMTYDYSNPMIPGPNSPLDWFTGCVQRLVPSTAGKDFQRQRAQLLTGVNFYGMDYVPHQHLGEAIVGRQFVSIVEKHRPSFTWHRAWAEHHITYTDDEGRRHEVYYPSALSIAQRLAKLAELGTGVSIWEIGQGLDSFYGLL